MCVPQSLPIHHEGAAFLVSPPLPSCPAAKTRRGIPCPRRRPDPAIGRLLLTEATHAPSSRRGQNYRVEVTPGGEPEDFPKEQSAQAEVEEEEEEDEAPAASASSWLERWTSLAREQGTRALDELKNGVESAISVLGGAFLRNRANRPLVEALRSGKLDRQDFYRQLLPGLPPNFLPRRRSPVYP